jgi:hypothetical protein
MVVPALPAVILRYSTPALTLCSHFSLSVDRSRYHLSKTNIPQLGHWNMITAIDRTLLLMVRNIR